MNYRMVAFVLGRIFAVEAGLMLFPLICAMLYGEWYLLPAFLLPAALLAAVSYTHLTLPGADECLRRTALCDFRRNTVLY